MSSDIEPMQEYFAQLGLEPEIADIYQALQAYGPQSLLQLSRNAHIERTRLYRLLDTLRDAHLIEIQEEYKKKIYQAAPISNLQILLAQREQNLRDLRLGLSQLQHAQATQELHSAHTHVRFYRGADGVKQMLWNETHSESETVSILFENVQTRTNPAFFERWVERCNQMGIHCRSIVGDHFLETQRQWYAARTNEKLDHWQGRYVPKSRYDITNSMVVYDDVVAYYGGKGDEAFGMEIHNQEVAHTQKQFFEMLWTQGKPVPGHGEIVTSELAD